MALAAATLLTTGRVHAATDGADAEAPSPPVTTVTATRIAQPLADVPASVGVVSGARIREAGPLLNLSEALAGVPGLGVLNRQNLAQDLQISSRGFGARSTFGVRGVRLYEDGIPLTMPDGQGQSSSFDLTAAQRIEVLRGPASALYGNASGGVVQLFTEDGPPVPEVTVGQAMSRDGFAKTSLKAAGQQGDLNYVVDASQATTDGYRDHSAATRMQLHTRLQWALDAASTFTLVGSDMAMPHVQDPLGLTAEQLAANPRQAGSNAQAYDTRKDIYNAQLGGIYERRLGADTVRVMLYGGTRQATQYQAITTNLQGPAAYPGGVIDLERHFTGLDARYTWRTQLLQQPLSITGGLSLDQVAEHREGYQNFDAQGNLGVQGALRRDEDNKAANRDQYLLAQWELGPQWLTSLGLRHSRVAFDSRDHYIVPGNGDDSGRMDFEATTPTASLMWRALPVLHLYVTAGESFETPTLNEVAYRSNLGTATGWNSSLKAAQGHHIEVGTKAGMGTAGLVNLALFKVDTDDEIAVQSNAGGRATYQNVGRTHRQGLEVSTQWKLAPAWVTYASATWTQAQYADAFTSISTGTTTLVTPGKALPGVPRRTAYAELAWRPAPQGWHAAVEWRHSGRLWANDVNDAFAPSYQLWALRTGWRQHWGNWRLDVLARIDNVANAHTVGSVIVNESNKRYFEPAPGRSATLAAYVTRSF
jgi:iron complex outermembrane receptor protein